MEKLIEQAKTLAVLIAFLGTLTTCAMAVQWWNDTWAAPVEPTRANPYLARTWSGGGFENQDEVTIMFEGCRGAVTEAMVGGAAVR